MRIFLVCLVALCCWPLACEAEEVQTDGWGTVVLWNSDVVSARLMFKPSASLADKHWLALELENHTQKPLDIGQTRINLDMTRKGIPSGEVLTTSGLSGGVGSIKTLPPGRHRFYDGDTFESASGNMGLPPVTGLRVEVQAKVECEIKGGNRYKTPEDKPSFTFEWRYPSAAERTEMIQEMRQYLTAPEELENHLSRMSALFSVPQVQESLMLDDYLPALIAARHNVRHLLVPHLFVKYADDPRVLAYYREAFQKEPDVVYWDAATVSVWNEEFLEPLVQGCEQEKWHYFAVLSRHTAEWRNRPPYVARVSAALLKHNPILRREVQEIPDNELEQWARAVLQAGEVADPAMVELLKPALEDRRQAWIDLGAGGINEGRVCDRALIAILQILDGDSWTAFEKAGITGWRTEQERIEAHDRLIKILTERLEMPPVKK